MSSVVQCLSDRLGDERVAELMGVSARTVRRVRCGESELTLGMLRTWMDRGGSSRGARAMLGAVLAGTAYVVVCDEVEMAGGVDPRDVARVMRETADVIDVFVDATRDGRIDDREAPRLDAEIDEAIQALFVLRRRSARAVRRRVFAKKPGRYSPQSTQRGTEGMWEKGAAG